MKTQYILLVISAAVVLSSCTVMGSLHPLSQNEKLLVFKKELLGKWINTKNVSESYFIDTIRFSHGKHYTIDVLNRTQDENIIDTIHLIGKLVEISNQYFLDCKVDEVKMLSDKKDIEDFIILKHIILRLSFDGNDNIEAVAPEPDELIKLIDAGKIKLQYTELDEDNYLILNSTEELQKAAVALNKYPEVYKSVVQLIRSK